MSWEHRNGKRYYYRNEWQHGRSIRTYCGTGDTAESAAAADALRRVQREMETRKWQQEQEGIAAAEALLGKLCEQADLLVHATLVAAGYHQHDRGSWRRKRERKSEEREERKSRR